MKQVKHACLTIVLTNRCNFFGVCNEMGGKCETIKEFPFEDLKKVIDASVSAGIRNFKIAGGEPTTVEYFGELIEFIMSKKDTFVEINTNGYRIKDFLDVLIKYRGRLCVRFCLELASEETYDDDLYEFHDFLVIERRRIRKMLEENGIEIVDRKKGETEIVFSEYCTKHCAFYSTGECQNAVYTMYFGSNLTLHWAGCRNQQVYSGLKQCNADADKIRRAISDLLVYIG